MKKIVLIGCFVLFSATHALAQPATKQNCSPNTVSVPVTYHFKDTDAQYAWIYHSLNPTLAMVQDRVDPISTNIEDGALKMTFCIPVPAETERLILRVGPRAYDLAIRPITKLSSDLREMSPILLVEQPRPDWVIVKSAKRFETEASDLPSFEVELYNFGQAHSGGQVVFEAFHYWSLCARGSTPARVKVQVSLSGQRLRIASSDPEYPEELVTRDAELTKNINSCSANFYLRTDFGTTGRLPPGPIRIRYTLKRAEAKVSLTSSEQIKYYFTRGYRLKVIGEGIW